MRSLAYLSTTTERRSQERTCGLVTSDLAMQAHPIFGKWTNPGVGD